MEEGRGKGKREGRGRAWDGEGKGKGGRGGKGGEGLQPPPPTLIPGAATDLTGLSLERRCDKACWACRHIDKA